MAIFETVLKSDLKKPVQVKQLSGNLFSGDNQGNKITVEVMDNGSPATLSGGVTGYVIREDNSTVIISSGTLSGNKASIVLPEEAYNVVGRVSIVVKVGTTTVGACTAYVYRTSTDTLVDPTGAIPSLQELLAKISACEQATADANKVANLTVSAEAATGSTPDAVLSETGSPAHKHITFKLVKGDKGDTGNTGATPQLSIGTVTTLQPSQDATVTITGTDEEPVLNFGIPQGASGNETIDDTAGIGDTDLVYSADKVRKELDTKAHVVDVPITTPASVQSFPDGADGLPMALTVGIEPVQDLHGQESPYPAGSGKNKFDIQYFADHYVTVSGSNVARVTLTLQANTAYTVSTSLPYVGGTKCFAWAGGAEAETPISSANGVSDGSPRAVTTDSNGKLTVGLYYQGAEHSSYYYTKVLDGTYWLQVEEGSSATSYVPYSNICPISGWMGANVNVAGFNVWDEEWEVGDFNQITGQKQSASDAIRSKNPIHVIPGKNYYYKNGSNIGMWIYYYRKDMSFVSPAHQISANSVIAIPSDVCYINFKIYGTYGTTYKNDICINISDPAKNGTYEAYTGNNTYPITFPSSAGTVYGGTVTVNKDGSGELVVDRKLIAITSDTSILYVSAAESYSTIAQSDADVTKDIICSSYKGIASKSSNNAILAADNGTVMFKSGDSCIHFKDSGSNGDETTFHNRNDGTTLLYYLANPLTFTLTVEQVKTLLGVNNIWADTGDILSVDYPADTKLYVDQQIADKISASQRLMELIVTANHEDEMKATKAYSTGELLIANGTLYKATASIANGANLTVNTNVTATTVAAELAALA